MRKRPELPPELADAIEFTAEFRNAMGFNHGDAEVVTEVPIGRPSNERITDFCLVTVYLSTDDKNN